MLCAVSQALCVPASVGMISLGALALSVAPAVDAGGFGEQRLIQWGRQMVRWPLVLLLFYQTADIDMPLAMPLLL